MRPHFTRISGDTLRTEAAAGITTFLTMAYIIFVNPALLSAAGVPFAGAATATALGAALLSILMGLVSNRPLALAAGMGLNAMVAFTIIGFQQANVPWQVGMAVVFVEGIIITILVLTGLREAIMHAIPLNLKRAIGVGIGLFLTFIGLDHGGLVVPEPNTILALGDFRQPIVWVTLSGLTAVMVFLSLRLRGAIMLGIFVAAAVALALGLVHLPKQWTAPLDLSTIGAPFQTVNGSLAVMQIWSPALLMALFALMMTDFFDTMGSVVAVGQQAGFLKPDGSVPGIKRILLVDSFGATLGGVFGCSSITTYVESAAGVVQGGRTGLMPIITGLLFVAAAFFSPVIAMIGGGVQIPNSVHYAGFAHGGFTVPASQFTVYPITAGALIVVGFLLVNVVRDIEWNTFDEAFPAFLTIIGIPLTYSISNGIGMGFLSWLLLKVINRQVREIHPLMWAVCIAFAVYFTLGS